MEFHIRAKLERILQISDNEEINHLINEILNSEEKKILFSNEQYDFLFDSENHIVFCGKVKIQLKLKESKLLRYILTHKNGLMTRNKILDSVWENNNVTDRNVDVQIHKLKKQIPYLSDKLRTIRSYGYVFED